MEKFYNEQDFITHGKQQIKCNNDLVKGLDIIMESVNKFNGKQLNKRLRTEIEEQLNKQFNHAIFYFNDTVFSDGKFSYLNIRDNDSYPVNQYGVNYVDYAVSMFIYTDTENKIDVSRTIEQIKQAKNYKNNESEKIASDIKYINEIKMEYGKIKSAISQFKLNHSDLIQKLYMF